MENILEKFTKNPLELNSDEKYVICKYFRKNKISFSDIREQYGDLCMLTYLKCYNYDILKDTHDEKMKNNKYYEYYINNNKKINNIDYYIDTIDEFYENILKLNVDKNFLVSSMKSYKNSYREGIMVKKQPYASCYTINIFSLIGGDVDINDFTIKNARQIGSVYHFNILPDKNDLINSIMIYDLLNKTKGYLVYTDINTFKCFDTAKSYIW